MVQVMTVGTPTGLMHAAQHSTAQHSTARHVTAQRSVAPQIEIPAHMLVPDIRSHVVCRIQTCATLCSLALACTMLD